MILRPYQTQAIAELRKLAAAGKKKLLLVSPTGSGKTVTFCEVIRSAVAKGSRALVLAHRRELITQASAKLSAFGVPHGIVLAGQSAAPDELVQVASVQTLVRRAGSVSGAEIIVVDEAHHTAARSYQQIIDTFPGALVLGVTATPWRGDGKGLADLFPDFVLAASPRQLRDEGFLVPVGGWQYEAMDTAGARVQGGDYKASDLADLAADRKVVGDIVGEWKAHADGARTVVFACSVDHSTAIVEAFRAAGVPAEHLDGDTPAEERDAILGRLRSGATPVVSNCMVLTEGWDCPEAEVCVLARPTLSLALYLQMVGRVLRPAPGKVAARIHDHANCLAAHGHPYADRDYSPCEDAKVNRKKAEGGKKARCCPNCKAVLPRWPCDFCGQAQPEQERIQEVEAARRVAIGEDGRATAQKKETDQERAERWRRRFANDLGWQKAFVQRQVAKHGAAKASRVCFWFSGFTWRAPQAWLEGGIFA